MPEAVAETGTVAARADFSEIRYGQCWEDADILLEALEPLAGAVCLSIASAGDNTLSLLSRAPARLVAIDLSSAQLACLELRVAAYRALSHAELLDLIGSTPSTRRRELYRRCRPALGPETRAFWDARPDIVERGIGAAGRFERYFETFRRRVLPLVHGRRTVERLLAGGDRAEREAFYTDRWDTWRWRAMFRLFFSRFVMGRLGRDPAFFRYVEGSVADRILARTRFALTELNPVENPYIDWILTGRHTTALPHALRPENFEPIRRNLDRLEWRRQPLEDCLAQAAPGAFDAFNLSDVFEYMPLERYHDLLRSLVRAARPGARLAYWNMLAPRRRPPSMADRLEPLEPLASQLFRRDKALFYSAFVVERVR